MVYRSDCYLPYSIHFSEFVSIFSWENGQNSWSPAFLCDMKNGLWRLLLYNSLWDKLLLPFSPLTKKSERSVGKSCPALEMLMLLTVKYMMWHCYRILSLSSAFFHFRPDRLQQFWQSQVLGGSAQSCRTSECHCYETFMNGWWHKLWHDRPLQRQTGIESYVL